MGQIQSSINQILGTATIGAGLYAQSPVGKRMSELRQLNLKEKTFTKRAEAIAENFTPDRLLSGQGLTETEKDIIDKTRDENISIAERRFELQPTASNLEALNELKSFQQIAAQKAEDSFRAEQDRIRAQRDLMNNRRNI